MGAKVAREQHECGAGVAREWRQCGVGAASVLSRRRAAWDWCGSGAGAASVRRESGTIAVWDRRESGVGAS